MKMLGLCVVLFLSARVARSGIAETFEGRPGFTNDHGTNTDNICTVIDDPGKPGNHVFKIGWKAQDAGYLCVIYADVAHAPVVAQAPGKYKITVRVNAEEVGDEVRQLALRVIDRDGECFQLRGKLEQSGAPGWTEVSWTFDTKLPETGGVKSWGGSKVNGVVDLPARLLGFAVDFDHHRTAGGTLLLDDVTVTRLPD